MIEFILGNIYISRIGERYYHTESDGYNFIFRHVDTGAYNATDINGRYTFNTGFDHDNDIVAEETK